MRDSLHGLRENLSQFQAFLRHGEFLSFSPAEKQLLAEDTQRLMMRLDGVAETFLTVGLLGGTGVGKSSIMNGLAGTEIASTSHRRPHTDNVLIYRHVAALLPAALQNTQVSWREITHSVDTIRQILLCDLPDFDSLEGEHRARVLAFLEHLDVLIWVTSPEKYADGRFYSFLRDVPKAHQNFYFVINKVDQLFQERNLETGFDQLAKVTGRFQEHLTDNDIPHPLIYALSAREAVDSAGTAPWNQFSSFRHQIFQHRDTKEVVAIKAANLDVEVRQFLLILEKEVSDLQILHGTLRDFVDELESERTEWVQSGNATLGRWLESHFNRRAYVRAADPSPLVGPGHAVASLIQELQSWSRREEGAVLVSGLFDDKGPLFSLQRHLKRLEDRLAHRLLQKGLPSAYSCDPEGILNAARRWEELCRRLQHFLEMRLASQETPSFRGFGILQYGAYLFLLVLFLAAVGGQSGWGNLANQPGWANLGTLTFAFVRYLFSPDGLAALASYIVLNILLGFRFYGRYKKFLQRRAQKFIESLNLESGKLWEEELDSILARLNERVQEVSSQMSIISELKKSSKEGA